MIPAFFFYIFSIFIFSLENEQLDQIVQCMEKKSVEPKNDIIIEGSVGERLFVLASGKVQVLQNDRVVHNLSYEFEISRFTNFVTIFGILEFQCRIL